MTHKDEARVLAHQRCAKCGNYGDSPSHLVGCAVASSPDPDEPLTPYGEALIQRVEDYRSGYSCGYSDAKNGTRMRDKDAASLFFNIGGVPDVSEHQLSQADRVEELAREICRELYDRFVMGGWEPQDAHAQIAALLRSRMVERDVKEKAFKLSHEINKRGWVTWEQIYEVFYPKTCDCKPIEFEDGVRHHVDCASRRPLPSAPDTEEAK